MSLRYLVEQKEYIVTVYDSESLDDIYSELETDGIAPNNTDIIRSVKVATKRPASKNTHYYLTEWEADALKRDPRIRSVELHPRYLGIQAGEYTTQYSDNWNKSASVSSTHKNFALLRCTEGANRPNWGSDSVPDASGTIKLGATGRNVDVIIVDGNGIEPDHPEFAVNEDGSGGSRVIQYNWYQHNPEVTGAAAETYSYPTGASASYHAVHVMGTVAGNTQGWARSANLYNLYYYAGAIGDVNFPYVMDYVRAFHANKSVNPETGRKNPTITNNSWGMSIFPAEWSYSDITAVTYRGTRYIAPGGTIEYTGFSGVCNASTLLTNFTNDPENLVQQIVTGTNNPVYGGSFSSTPPTWTLNVLGTTLTYESTASTTGFTTSFNADITSLSSMDIVCGFAASTIGGTFDLAVLKVDIFTPSDLVNPYQTYSVQDSGTTIDLDIAETYAFDTTGQWQISVTLTIQSTDLSGTTYAESYSFSLVELSPTGADSVNIVELPFTSITSVASLTASTTPTSGGTDDGYWTVSIPWGVSYLGTTYNNVYVGTNMYLTFGTGSSSYSSLSAANPPYPKIMVGSADNSTQRIYFGEEGTIPNREYRIVIEGNASTSGTLSSPGMRMEYRFYENDIDRIDLTIEQNNRKTSVGGGFTSTELQNWGLINGQRIPVPVAALDADIEQAMDEGIIFVGAAGNGRWKHDVPGGLDWDNTFEMGTRYPESVSNPYYYMRGTSPTRNDNTINGTYDLPMITVGAIDKSSADYKVNFSDCGPGVDIWAPGTSIMSSWNGSAVTTYVSDPRNESYTLAKISGTSMASPQVCGVLACILEVYPNFNQEEAKEYLIYYSKKDQINESYGGPMDIRDLQGSPNRFLFYPVERIMEGQAYPKRNYKPRPVSGLTYPRPRIRRSK